jgi:dTDP-glucose 4,6-dehydratase
MYKPRSMMVTGAAGFIGSHFVRMMSKRYPDLCIISYDKLTYAGNINNLQGVESNHHFFVHGDILDKEKVLSCLREYNIDTIVHFAAESHVDNSIEGPAVFFETNVMGTLSLLEASRSFWLDEKKWDLKHCRFHHVSTDEVYGSLTKDAPAFTETTPYSPNSPYAASKAGSDHAVRSYITTYKLPATLSNCSNNYGPNQHDEKLIPVVVRSCLDNKSIPVYGDGSNIRDWLYVEDHCDAIDLILQRGRLGETYNIGGDNEIDNMTLVNSICEVMDVKYPKNAPHQQLITMVQDRKGHDWRYAIDSLKLKKELSWAPSAEFKLKLEKTVDFFCLKQVETATLVK